jgi:hypothetical protein
MNETAFNRSLLLHLSQMSGVSLFRNNVGQGWVGKVIRHAPYEITLANPRPLHAGLTKGSADNVGWTSIEITQEMVGKRVAVFTSIEAKFRNGHPPAAQKIWHENVTAAGGISGVARTIEEGKQIINGYK